MKSVETTSAEMMTPAEAVALVGSLTWTYAKTMPFAPHWYIVRDRDLDTGRFEQLVRHIRGQGRPGIWGHSPRSTVIDDGRIVEGLFYCDIGEHRYWTMGWPVAETTVVNRDGIETSRVRFIDVAFLEERPELLAG
jgi:hypothetical protein